MWSTRGPAGPTRPPAHGPRPAPPRVYIQLAAYGGPTAARAERQKLARLGFPWLGVRRALVRHRLFYLLRIGPIPTIGALDRLDNRARRFGFAHPMIVIRGGKQ